jgi:L-amino acid N-acyltransferase YncA
MSTDIRLATVEDAQRVAVFLSHVYETRHGIGSAGSLEMLQRTVVSLFTDDEAVTVFVSEDSGVLQGVAAARHAVGVGTCELIFIQATDNVQGRGVAQTLLRYLVENCAARGGDTLMTSIPSSDVRARGFLRREGFLATAGEHALASPKSDEDITYVLDVGMALTLSTMSDEAPDAPDAADS